jgi:hypothetical protein
MMTDAAQRQMGAWRHPRKPAHRFGFMQTRLWPVIKHR